MKLIWINLVDGSWVFGCLENGGFNEILGGRGAARGVGVAGPWWMEISKSLLSLSCNTEYWVLKCNFFWGIVCRISFQITLSG